MLNQSQVFEKKVNGHLIKRTSGFNGADQFVTLLLDKMKIKKKIIFVKHTGNFTDFIDLGDTDISTLNFEKKEDLAKDPLVYFVSCAF